MRDSAAYGQLVELEREIDYKILTKQTQIADAAFKVCKVGRKLFLSETHI